MIRLVDIQKLPHIILCPSDLAFLRPIENFYFFIHNFHENHYRLPRRYDKTVLQFALNYVFKSDYGISVALNLILRICSKT